MPLAGRIICQVAEVPPQSTRAWMKHGLEIVRVACHERFGRGAARVRTISPIAFEKP